VGCIYTAQGFEVDYAGVIIGEDLRYDPDLGDWVPDPSKSSDSAISRRLSREDQLRLLKQAYRVLLSRGMKGCYVYAVDPETRKFLQSRTKLPSCRPAGGIMVP
jgi:DUF2075 family protein